jgi:hypothetical protein
VVVRSELARAAVAVMGPLAQDPPRRTSVPCPSGWVGYEYEPVRSAAPGPVVGSLAVLSPRGGEIVTLEGGLAVSARSRLYLTAGPPDVLFDLTISSRSLEVDRQAAAGAGTAGRLRLAGRGLTEGVHDIDVGGAHLGLRLVDEHSVGPMDCTLGTRLRAGISPAGRPWTVPLPQAAADGQEGADVVVQGASVDRSARADVLPQPATGLGAQARAGGRHYALADGHVAVRVYPQAPAWLLELEPRPVPHLVQLTGCAAGLPFTPGWFLRIAQDRASVVPAGPPITALPADDAAEMANAWEEVLPWLADAAVAQEQADAWAAWLAATCPDTTEAS